MAFLEHAIVFLPYISQEMLAGRLCKPRKKFGAENGLHERLPRRMGLANELPLLATRNIGL